MPKTNRRIVQTGVFVDHITKKPYKRFGEGFYEYEEITLDNGRVVKRKTKVMPEVEESIKNLKETGEEFPSFTFPGSYPMFYITKDNGVLCPKCCNDNREQCLDFENNDGGFSVVMADVNYENRNLFCDHCSKKIEAAYV